jgi:multidrug efflux pump subunit AcrA (membrane-fusion protein)
MRRAATDALKSVTGAYDTLNKASALTQLDGGKIEEAFFPSVSTFEALMGMESKYLNLLNLGSGAITINRAELKRLTAARVEDLAVTQAMALADTIAVHREDAETLREMAGVTQQATNATWDLVYAKLAQQNLDKDLNDAFTKQIDAMRQLSKRTQIGIYLGIDDSSIQNLLQSIFQKVKGFVSDMLKEIKAFVQEFINALKQTYKDMLSNEKSGLDDVLKLTMDLIRYEIEQKIKGLRDQIAAYKEIVSLKKQELDLARQQASYEEGVAERVAAIAKLQAEIAQLKLDDSREAKAQRIAKEQELAEKQKDLAKYQDDHAYDEQIRALDDAAEAHEKQKQTEIEALEATISSAEKVYQLAIARLEEDFWGLYDQVIAWNTEAGNSINSEITAAWKEAAKAVTLYMGYLNAVKAVDLQLRIQTEGLGAVIADALVDAFSGFFTKVYDLFAGFANKILGVFGLQLPTSGNTSTGGKPINPGSSLLGVVGDVIGGAINGIIGGVKNFIGGIFSKFPFFHSGGHVGGKVRGVSSDPAEEVIAVLQSDEVVLTKQQQKTLLTQMDFLRELGATCGGASVASLRPVQSFAEFKMEPQRFDTFNQNSSVTVSAPIEVIIQHSGALDDASAVRFGRQIADTASRAICEAFRKKGIRAGGGNGALKQ